MAEDIPVKSELPINSKSGTETRINAPDGATSGTTTTGTPLHSNLPYFQIVFAVQSTGSLLPVSVFPPTLLL